MENKKTTTDNLIGVIAKEKVNFSKKDSVLSDVYVKFSKMGIDTKSTYSLPLKDTIGKTIREQMGFKLS